MEEVLEQAEKQGLTVVQSDDAGFQQLLTDYTRVLGEAEKLCDIVDDEKTPFASKYKAREMLDQLLRNVEAHHTICSLEKQKDKMDLLKEKIASLQLKIGTISWDCEEPHNAQKELEEACSFYFPSFVQEINDFIQDREVNNIEDGALHPEVRNVIAPIDFNHIQLPVLPIIPGHLVVDAMRCLNLLGILWAGRAQPYKSLHYLLSAHSIHDLYYPSSDGSSTSKVKLSAEVMEDLDSTFTHNLFYLAQAYGNLGNTKESSHYCQQTLQRQLLQKSNSASSTASNARLNLPHIGLNDYKMALDWVKNCCGIADFYLAMNYYQCSALALASAEKILSEKVIKPLYDEMNAKYGEGTVSATNKPNFSSGHLNAVEIEADLHRRWAALYITLLHRASDREKEIASYQELAGNTTDAQMESERLRNVLDASDQEDEALIQKLLEKTKLNTAANEAFPTEVTGTDSKGVTIEFFEHLPVTLPSLLHINDIQSFEQARSLFLRGSAKIEAAKKYFVMDGYVTDHCTLLQENSKLYHYLASFELDLKRRLAMELRRTELLIPVLKSLNRSSYEVLHKQIAYELGETALVLIDLKLDKFREKDGKGKSVFAHVHYVDKFVLMLWWFTIYRWRD